MIVGMIRAIAFDFGGTLFSTARMGTFTPRMTDTFIAGVARELQCSREIAENVFAAYCDLWKARRARGGDLPERETSSLDLLESATSNAGASLTRDQMVAILNAFHSEESKQFTPLSHVLESLPELGKMGYRLCIVGNNPWAESILASLRRYGVESIFDHVVVSCDVGFRKPHRPIFDDLMARIGFDASKILFVGDSFVHDIEVPKAMGMKTCLVDFEGTNKNNQKEEASQADLFLTSFDQLGPALRALG
jgi:HAD superfamily hydrolase (TIGR01549 family)